MKRKANITAAIACILWGWLFLSGRSLIYHVYEHGAGVYPSAGQIDFYMVFPLIILVAIGASAWIVNGFGRWYAALAWIAGISLFAALPFLLFYTGGM